MADGHAHALGRRGKVQHDHSPVHQLAPAAKILGAFLIACSVAVTPAQAPWAFALHAVLVGGIAGAAKLSLRHVASRLLVVVPFLFLAATIPFVSGGEKVELLGLVSVSRLGLTAGLAIACKSLLGATVSIIVASTTAPSAIARGMRTLRAPHTLVTIALLMLRYLDVVAGEVQRQRRAMTSRGHDPRWLWQARPIASGAGALFVRSYERGERVHAAMASRGFSGSFPATETPPTRTEWTLAAAVGLSAVLITLVAVTSRVVS